MSEKVEKAGDLSRKTSQEPRAGEVVCGEVQLARHLGSWEIICIAWNVINVFGGLSYIFVVGFSAGGLSTIFYGFLGSTACTLCTMSVLAECASLFPTAGGAYHFSTFLCPEKYRRYVGYPVGWLNYLGWVFTVAACSAIQTGLTFSLVIMCDPTYVVSGRWQYFLVYVAWAAVAWVVNLYFLRGLHVVENLGCIISMLGFVGFTITLLARAPKADASFVFTTINNETGYSSSAMAVAIGLYNCVVVWVSLDAVCHLAEEVPQPTRIIPKTLYIIVATQLTVGVVWILTVGFSVTDMNAVTSSATGVPIIELIRLALKSDAAAITFNVMLLVNFFAALTGCLTSASRQGYALARDGGLFFKKSLVKISTRTQIPSRSVDTCFGLTVLIGLVYLFSSSGFNAIIGTEAVFMLLSYASPSVMMLIFGRSQLKKTPFSLGRLGYPICVISVIYTLAVVVLVMFPGVHPITASNFNYNILLTGIFAILCVVIWLIDGRKSYKPPSFTEFIENVATNTTEFLGGGKQETSPEESGKVEALSG